MIKKKKKLARVSDKELGRRFRTFRDEVEEVRRYLLTRRFDRKDKADSIDEAGLRLEAALIKATKDGK